MARTQAQPRQRAPYRFYDRKPPSGDMLAEVIAGLSASPKRLSPKFFYDEEGSRLFEAITELPEYYPTRTEVALFQRYVAEIAEAAGEGVALIEYGSGSSLKIRVLLEGLEPRVYVPVDISGEHLDAQSRALHADFPWIGVYPTCADFSQPFALPPETDGLRKMAFFPGSSIGNFDPRTAVEFLVNVTRVVGSGRQAADRC